jgi:hypothetical protein
MTEQEIAAIEKARAWIYHDVLYGDSPAIQNKAQDITDVLDEIIQKHRAMQEPEYREDHMGRTF